MKRSKQPQPGRIEGVKGRGALSNPENRYARFSREAFDDGWGSLEAEPERLKTTLQVDQSRSVITYNQSPDVPFDRSLNPYRGCEHGCIYCYARPTHAWLGHSPGLDFESRLYHKPDMVDCLRRELAADNYQCAPLAVGGITDAYQPVEQELRLTRKLLELLESCAHPLTLITKSSLVERDIDLLAAMARKQQVQVIISFSTLKQDLSRKLEPRAAAPQRRLQTIHRLAEAGIPVGVLVAPVIPVLTDSEMERIMSLARQRGALNARYILLRLPLEVASLFSEWLQVHVPDQAQRVLRRIRDTRGGELYQTDFRTRMTGQGAYAELLAQRFQLAWKRLGFQEFRRLDCRRFVKPAADPRQLSLW
ncbi:MAG: PA0069 family radical SAM protein [Gammaproteobacteria bacterium]|nr:PA0069 family radical SAM protein [Gammaproteobacteria bacterium]